MDDRVAARMNAPRAQRPARPDDAPVKSDNKDLPPRGIDFGTVLRRSDRMPQKESAPLTIAQIAQLAEANDFPTLRDTLRGFAKQQDMTLARACEIALDVGLDADKNEGIKPKLQRGALIDKILQSVDTKSELVLKSEEISMIKNRVGSVFQQAYVVRQICLILDPATGVD